MSSKLTSLLLVALLLYLSLTSTTARPLPSSSSSSSSSSSDVNAKVQHGLKDLEVEKDMEEVRCDGVGEDECLMRRTLAAHTDYIYTQKNNP